MDARPADSPATPTVTSAATRFLYPFYFNRGTVAEAVDALCEKAKGGAPPHWKLGEAHEQYTDEFLDHVVTYLFPKAKAKDPKAFVYLQADAARDWFRGVRLSPPDHHPNAAALRAIQVGMPEPVDVVERTNPLATSAPRHEDGVPVAVDPKRDADRVIPAAPAVELFLSAQGVGILSVTLTASGPLTAADVVAFNYGLSQSRFTQSVPLVKGTGESASVEAALTGPDGTFVLQNVITWLTKPLEKYDRRPIQPKELCVYTVVRFAGADFGTDAARAAFAPVLSALAQVEPSGTSGPVDGHITVPTVVINRHHWAAVGVLGAAHLVADQPTAAGRPMTYNDIRPMNALNKYFISYLVAVSQQHTTHQAVHEAATILGEKDDKKRREKTSDLRGDLLRFGVGGLFNQVSSRHSHHRYYRACREALDVQSGWENVSRAIADLDADLDARQQEVLADRVRESVFEIEVVQKVVHGIEYLLAAVYLAHFWHMFAHHNKWLEHEAEKYGVTNWDAAVSVGMLVAAALGVVIVWAINQWRAKHTADGSTSA